MAYLFATRYKVCRFKSMQNPSWLYFSASSQMHTIGQLPRHIVAAGVFISDTSHVFRDVLVLFGWLAFFGICLILAVLRLRELR